MATMIAGHVLTRSQVRTLDEVIDYLRAHSGDSHWSQSRNVSPKGDGRPVSLREMWPGGGNANAGRRRSLWLLMKKGVLDACELRAWFADGDWNVRGEPRSIAGQQAVSSASAGSLPDSNPNGGRVENKINERHELPQFPSSAPSPQETPRHRYDEPRNLRGRNGGIP